MSSTLSQHPIIAKVAAGLAVTALAGLGAYHLMINTRRGRSLTRGCLLRMLNALPESVPKTKPFAQRVQPHGPIEKLHDGLWVVKGTLPNMGIPRYMTIYRPPNSTSLLLYSVLCLDPKTLAEVNELGNVTHIFIPCSWHTMDATAYKTQFPNAKMMAPRSALADLKDKVDGEVVAAEDVFPLYKEKRSSTSKDHGSMENSVQLFYPEGCSKEFDECELVVTLSPPATETGNLTQRKSAPTADIRHALIMNDMFHEDLSLTFMVRILALDDLPLFRKWMQHDLIDKVVVGENVEVVIVSHGTPVVGKEQVLRKMNAALVSV